LAITESQSFTAEEALEAGFIDDIVGNVPDLIARYDGREILRFDGSTQTLDLGAASIEIYEMNARQRVLSTIMNPNIALVLGLLGLVGLYLEFTNPGLIVPGVVGGISLLLALFAFNLLPVNLAGALLIVLAIALFVVEATVPSNGILALGGVASMIAGGLMLVEGPIPELRIQLPTILSVAVPLAVITIVLVRLVFVSHRAKTVTGGSGMVGEIGTAITEVFDKGKVLVHGEYWGAHSIRPIAKGARVRVVNVKGLNVEVETVTEESS
jgi:membrane-bound serine protease (ClpP class)